MESRALGATSLLVSRLGLGLAAMGRPGYINLGHAGDLGSDHDVATLETHCHRVLDAAWELGVRYFDAARSYGRGEAFLASWLAARRIGVHEVAIGSKWGYTYTAAWKIKADHHEIKEHSLPVLQRQTAESRALLGSYLKLYQIHSATLESGVFKNHGVLEELDRMRASGLHIGLTVSGAQQAEVLRQALEVKVGGQRLFACVQATWNLLEPSAGPILQAAHEAGLGVIVKEALANGRLTTRNADPACARQRTLLEKEGARLQTTMDALALAAVLAQPWADVVLSGAATEAQLRTNVRALSVPWDRPAAERLTALVETADVYWRTRGRLTWN
jgi:aryl-alcohol dehydrogenase-like predicted oxidoreductase